MSFMTSRQQRRQLERENAKRPLHLEPVPRDDWPALFATNPNAPKMVWRSRDYLVQLYREAAPAIGRLSVLRTSVVGADWADGIPWDDLQRLKAEAGFADCWAVEVFPAAGEVINVANVRHLWLLDKAPDFAWLKTPKQPQPDPEARAQYIKLRRLQIAATLAEWKRAFFVEGKERTMAERTTLEAEDAALALEARVISTDAEMAKVERRKRQNTAMLAQLQALLKERGMDDVLAEAEKRAAEGFPCALEQ